jgi:hypothetical protein
MKYFRRSFASTLPWSGLDSAEYFSNVIVANVAPSSVGSLNSDGSVASYTQYVGTRMVSETAGWAMFTWFVTWLCVFRGVGLTGRVIYVTMGLPLVLIIILIGRGVSLPNAGDGIKLYFGTWRTEALATPAIWQGASKSSCELSSSQTLTPHAYSRCFRPNLLLRRRRLRIFHVMGVILLHSLQRGAGRPHYCHQQLSS